MYSSEFNSHNIALISDPRLCQQNYLFSQKHIGLGPFPFSNPQFPIANLNLIPSSYK